MCLCGLANFLRSRVRWRIPFGPRTNSQRTRSPSSSAFSPSTTPFSLLGATIVERSYGAGWGTMGTMTPCSLFQTLEHKSSRREGDMVFPVRSDDRRTEPKCLNQHKTYSSKAPRHHRSNPKKDFLIEDYVACVGWL